MPDRSVTCEAGNVAIELLAALDESRTLDPITTRDPRFDSDAAYLVSAEMRRSCSSVFAYSDLRCPRIAPSTVVCPATNGECNRSAIASVSSAAFFDM